MSVPIPRGSYVFHKDSQTSCDCDVIMAITFRGEKKPTRCESGPMSPTGGLADVLMETSYHPCERVLCSRPRCKTIRPVADTATARLSMLAVHILLGLSKART